jgi:predicted transcriptional regulator
MTAITQDNMAAFKDLVDDNSYISIDYIADVLGISHGSVHPILREYLRLKLSSK